MKKLILLLLIAGAAVTGIYFYKSGQPAQIAIPEPMPAYGEVQAEHVAPYFYEGMPENFTIVDVRTTEEYEKQHTAGTLNIPVAIFEESDDPCEEIMSKLPSDKNIIFVCPFGPRAKDMFLDLTAPVDDLGCGMEKEGMFYIWDRVRFKPDTLVIQKAKR